MRKIVTFLIEIIKLALNKPKALNLPNLIGNYSAWRASLQPGKNPLADATPWIAFEAVHFLENVLYKDMRVYEFGSGGSSLYFSQRVKEVISIEHDPEWYNHVQNRINSAGITNCALKLFEPTTDVNVEKTSISDPNGYVSSDDRYTGKSFYKYASYIDEFPNQYFDVIVIDGRARPSCFKHASTKLKMNGYLVLDNSETTHYNYIHMTLKEKGWKKYEFYGLFPYISHFSETCIWQRRK